MNVRKSLLFASAVAVLGLGGIAALHAAPTDAAGTGSTSLIDRLVQRFNLNKSDVQDVFDEQRQAMETQREQDMKDRLAQLVTDGKLTQAQADAISAKHDELKSFMDSLKDKTPQERRDALKSKMDEVKQWAQDNNIPLQYLHVGGPGPGGFGHGFGGHMGMGMMHHDGDADDAPSGTSN